MRGNYTGNRAMRSERNIAIILSGGEGSRLGFEKPKQFVKFSGKTCIEHTLDIFCACKAIDSIILVSNPQWLDETKSLTKAYSEKKHIEIVAGGATRNQSTHNALIFLREIFAKDACSELDSVRVLIHDVARPLLSQRIIQDCLSALESYKAVDVAVPAIDTIVCAKDLVIESIPKRENLFYGQTPQCFWFDTLWSAYAKALEANSSLDSFSDDCGVVKQYMPQVPIHIVQGAYNNHKLTRIEDVPLLDRLFQLKTTQLHENLDFEALRALVVVVFGGSSGIGAEMTHILREYGAIVYVLSKSAGCDIADSSAVQKALHDIYEREHRIDVIINMAGILHKAYLKDMDEMMIHEMIATNYIGAVNIAKHAYAYLAESRGALIFASSSSYSRGREEYAIYSSSKAAIVNFTQALSDEYALDGIRVHCVVPERTLTPMRVKNFGHENPATLLDPKEVARECIGLLITRQTGVILHIKRR